MKTQLDQDRAAEVARIAAECHAMAAGGQSLGSASSNTEASDDSLDGSDAEAEEERRDACYLRVRASPSVLNNAETEEDIIRQRCQELRGHLRDPGTARNHIGTWTQAFIFRSSLVLLSIATIIQNSEKCSCITSVEEWKIRSTRMCWPRSVLTISVE